MRVTTANGNNAKFATVSRFPSGAPFVEAFGLLSANLLLSNVDGNELRTLCLIGAEAGHGVSTTALNLALTIAGAKRRTLLVDANFRTPVLHVAFNVPQAPGFTDVLLKSVLLKDAVRASKASNLYLLPSGTLNV